MNNVFITRSNMQKLEHAAEVTRRDVTELVKQYQLELENILAYPELKLLTATKLVLETIEESYHLIEVDYSQLKIKKLRLPSNARWVYLGGSPAYHLSKDCKKLHQDYLNFEIPKEVPEHQVAEYRKFFLDNISLLHEDAERFYIRISTKFGLKTSQVRSVRFDNSSFDEVRNISLNPEKIIYKIKAQVAEMNAYRNSNAEIKKLIKTCGFATHKAKDYRTNLRFIDSENEHPVKTWHTMKQKLKGMILDHIIAKTNPDLAFNKSVLDSAGFTQCRECNTHNISPLISELTKSSQ